MSALADVARAAARAGGRVIAEARRSGRRPRVSTKAAADFVTEVDVAAERAIVGVVRDAYPDHAVLAEEGVANTDAAGDDGYRWVIDPLDGTTNFIRDLPCFAVSVACEQAGRPVAAAVLDVVADQLYSAAQGEGAERDGAAIAVSQRTAFEEGLWLTGIPFRNVEVLPRFLPGLERMASGSLGIRRMGSAALDLCFVACGRAEGFWEYGLSRWDTCAGALIVEEAGGRVTDFSGGAGHLDSGDIVASNGRLHDVLLARVGEPER